ncbi:MAG: hypothetical protein JO002_15975 [Burkholderiaceae bacterium]|nr:hypothetical protein [Burkholderiaceae bacterium]
MLCAVAWRLILARWPALAWDEAGPTKVSKRDILSGLCGIVLALLPYCFFYALFGVPSLTGKYFTSPSLITANRLISLVADFDQGMLFGLPGLFAAPVLACLLLARGRRLAWLAAALAMLAALLVMAVPTLAAQNWNSGCVVVSRYGYWLAMPLAAAALSAMARLSLRRAGAVAALGAACQGAVIAQYGWLGQDSNALEHSRIAAWVLEHHPTLYHPDPEIFYERTTHGEAPLPLDLTLVYDYNGRQLKLMRNAAVVEPTPDFCPPGLRLEGINRTKVDRDWEYEDAPFTCKPPEAATGRTAWSFKRGHGDSQALLVAGWSKMEPFCTWSDGPRSELNLPLPANGKPLRIRTHGYYYLDQEKSELEADGKHLDAMDLHDGTFDLPASFNNKPYLKLVLQHPQASSPAARGDSPDVRQLGFCMEMISVESPE